MRPDVKLGMIVSLVVVFVAGGYYIYRDAQEKPIPLSGGNVVATTPQTQHDPPTAPPAHERSKTAAPQEKKDRAARIAERRTKTEAGKSSETPKVDGAEQRTRRSADGKQKNTRRKPRRGPSKQAKSAQQTREKGTQTTGKQQEDKGTAKPTQQAPRRRARVTEKKSGNVERPTQGGGQQPRTQTARRKMTGRDAPVESGSQRADFPGTRNQSVALVSTSKERTDARNVALDTHRVQSGDTFASLALSYYGSEKHTQFLIDSNPHVGDPRRLAIDTKIKIPPLPPASESVAARSSTTGAKSPDKIAAGRRTYTVKPGDSFYAIARTVLGDASRWKHLFALNRDLVGGDPKKLQVGQVLALPAG